MHSPSSAASQSTQQTQEWIVVGDGQTPQPASQPAAMPAASAEEWQRVSAMATPQQQLPASNAASPMQLEQAMQVQVQQLVQQQLVQQLVQQPMQQPMQQPLSQSMQLPMQRQSLVPLVPPGGSLPAGNGNGYASRARRQTVPGPVPGPAAYLSFVHGLPPHMSMPPLGPAGPPQRFDDDDDIGLSSAAADIQPEPHPAAVAEGSVSVSTRIEYSALPRGQSQDVFGLVSVQAASQPASREAAERQPTDIVCVLDVSGSMQGDKIRSVQRAVRFVVEQADPRDRISIVAFNSSAKRVLRLCRMDGDGKDSAVRATLQLQANGGTCIARGLDMGISIMEQRRQKNDVSAILLLTDGQDSRTAAAVPSLLERARLAGCSVYAFGFGRDHDAALLSSIAEQAQTPFSFIESDDHIGEAFAGAVGGLTSVVAQKVCLTLNLRVPLKNIHTPFTVRRVSDSLVEVSIPDLFAGERRDILVELSAPVCPDENGQQSSTTFLEASATYKDLSRNGATLQTPPAQMQAERVAEPQPEVEPDVEVQAQRERVEVAQALQSAAALSDAGNFQAAQSMLESKAVNLGSKSRKSRMTEALTSELNDASRCMRSRMDWEAGGRAQTRDACQMHSVQRCTNTVSMRPGDGESASKALYNSPAQAMYQQMSKSSRR
eukprot:TRINITY_DN5524_c0_g1_i1.p1 TRINITY_DN5524_c0_g1~~TRINITY_DN5524_c0_g1_i1.p1  ORF type:complete len:661 (-),score=185.34 TRINITY_DN5524_c0_g1_i1:417-2399(-)